MRPLLLILCAGASLLAQAPPAPPPASPPRLGVFVYEDDQDGMLVDKLRAEGPAARAGVKVGDRIVRLGDVAVRRDEDLVKALQGLRPGHSTVIEVIREGQAQALSLTLTASAPPPEPPRAGDPATVDGCLLRALQFLAPPSGAPDVAGAVQAIGQARSALAREQPKGTAVAGCEACRAAEERCRPCLIARIDDLRAQVEALQRRLAARSSK